MSRTSRPVLLALQLLVAAGFVALWHVVTAYPVMGEGKTMRFVFSTPWDVGARLVKKIAGRLPARNYRFSALVLEIVNSLPFQSRRPAPAPAPVNTHAANRGTP
jgi:hypothetical protein